MRKQKYMLAQFTFYDRTGIRKLLELQAERGWRLEAINALGWRFRRMEPKKIHYAVTYFPKASAYDPGPSEQQKELMDFCAHSGWILAATSAQLQIFYNEAENPVPIETDPVLELENIHKSAKKNYLPAYFLLLCLAVFQICTHIGQLVTFPLTYLSQSTTLFGWLCQSVLLFISAQELLGYFLWYRKAKQAAEEGEFLETKGHRQIQLILLTIVFAGLIMMMFSMKPQMSIVVALSIGATLTCSLGVVLTQQWMKKRGTPTEVNRAVTLVSAIVLAVVITGVAVYGITQYAMSPKWDENRLTGTYEINGITVDLYGDPIPLNIEDLMEVTSKDYSREAYESCSPLLMRGGYSQMIYGPSKLPDLHYKIYSTRISWIYNRCIQELMEVQPEPVMVDEQGRAYYEEFREQDPSAWGAGTVYRRYFGEDPTNRYVLLYPGKVIELDVDWELTEAQMTKIGELLG